MSVCPLSRIADALERIAANRDAETILAERRRTKAAQQARYRASNATTVDTTKRTEEVK